MACDLTIGRLEPCKDVSGGIKKIFFIDYTRDLLSTATFDSNNQITAFATALTLYEYELRGNGHNFVENLQVSGDTGTRFNTQTLTAVIKQRNIATRKEFMLLAAASPHIVILDNNGNYVFAGIENGFDITIEATTGSAMGELNGYNITATAQETDFAFFVDPTIIDDATNTNVTSGT